jgi:hypothetical protein
MVPSFYVKSGLTAGEKCTARRGAPTASVYRFSFLHYTEKKHSYYVNKKRQNFPLRSHVSSPPVYLTD